MNLCLKTSYLLSISALMLLMLSQLSRAEDSLPEEKQVAKARVEVNIRLTKGSTRNAMTESLCLALCRYKKDHPIASLEELRQWLEENHKIKSCSGCSLNRLHEVKKFIFDDLPFYHNVEFKSIGGAKPELILLNKNGDELERIALSKLNRNECNKLLESKGFYRKASLEEEVPEEFKSGPYFPREDL